MCSEFSAFAGGTRQIVVSSAAVAMSVGFIDRECSFVDAIAHYILTDFFLVARRGARG